MRPAGIAAVLVDSEAEQTQLTKIAYEVAGPLLEDVGPLTGAFQVCRSVGADPFIVELHGQSSRTGHGKQGLRPSRIRLLRSLDAAGVPVFLGFCEGREKWRMGWLRELPAARAVTHGEDDDPETARYGWRCDEFPETGPLRIPSAPPDPEDYRLPPQESLI